MDQEQEIEDMSKAFELLDAGIPLRDVLVMFPDSENELKELLSLREKLIYEGSTISPSPNLLTSILDNLHIAERKQKKGFFGVWNFDSFPFKLFVPAALALAVLGALIVSPKIEHGQLLSPTASISADELSNELLIESASEDGLINQSSNDVQQIGAESQTDSPYQPILTQNEF